MQILITPFDTLFFRDGKPFSMGEETIANSIFPPNPSTIHGAITSLFLHEVNSLEELKNLKDSIMIKNICILNDNGKIFYPLPLDVLEEKNDINKVFKLSIVETENIVFSINISTILKANSKGLKNTSGFISVTELKQYLKQSIKWVYFQKELYSTEYKIGIGLKNETKSIEEGKLYRVKMLRLQETKILVEIDTKNEEFKRFLNKNKKGFLKLGGEGKVCSYEVIENNIKTEPELDIDDFDGIFKIYLRTPAIFENGYIANWMEDGEYNGLKFKFLTAAIGKPKYIGGFDLKNNKIKKMYKAVPEGSVYYFRTEEKDFEKIKNIFKDSISDIYKYEGYGLVFVGR